MIRLGATALLLFAFAGEALSQAADPEKVAAHKDHHACLYRAARDLDDGRSDAATIARGIMPMCSTEWARIMASYARSMSGRAFAGFEANVSKTRIDDATRAVLVHRSSKRRNSN